MSSGVEHLDCNASTVAQTLADICDAFDREWYVGAPPRIEEWLGTAPPELLTVLFRRLLAIELAHRALDGQAADEFEYRRRFPQFAAEVADEFRAEPGGHTDSRERSYSSTDLWGRIAAAIDPVHIHASGDAVGRYRLLERVGRGGFGEVWKAFDPELNRQVAIKLARSDRARSAELIEQLRTEARRAAGLKHNGIVPVYDIVNDPLGAYIVSEFIEGETLSSRMRRSAVPIADAVRIVVQVARALHYAHTLGVVHRDVKPGNILLRAGGGAMITDFGLAATEEELVRERSGTFGTVRYMSPEQVRGESHTCDGRTDIYSLGVVLYELLTHRAPYTGENSTEYKSQVLTRPARPLRTIDESIEPALEQICLKCLSKRVEDRYSTGEELAWALSGWQTAGTPRWWRRRGLAAAAVVVAGLCAAAPALWSGKAPSASVIVGHQATAAAFRPVAWAPRDSNDTYNYREEDQRFVFNTLSPALFVTGQSDVGGIEAEVVFSSEDENGMAGIFWEFQSGEEGDYCRTLLVGRLSEHHEYEVLIEEMHITEVPGARRGVTSQYEKYHRRFDGPTKERTRVRLEADAQEVRQVWVNGLPVLSAPVRFPERNLPHPPGGGWGVIGAHGAISILTVRAY